MSLDAHVVVKVGDHTVDVELGVGEGEVLALLGPNGAGKTTVLRALSGLTPLDSGRVVLDDVVLDDPSTNRFLPPRARRVSMMFQDLVLFPHLDVTANVSFGLRSRGYSRHDAGERATAAVRRVGLADRARAEPGSLSGGEAQRVALARALVTEPSLLLLDEPLAALDVGGRDAVRRDLSTHLGEFRGSCVLVTHDPLDAAVLADRIAIIEDGRIVQTGTLDDITACRQSPFAADLAGVNLLRGEAEGDHVTLTNGGGVAAPDAGAGPVLVLIHPHSVALHRKHPEGSARNVWECTIESLTPVGRRMRVRLGGTVALVAEVTADSAREMDLVRGMPVWCSVKATEIVTYPG